MDILHQKPDPSHTHEASLGPYKIESLIPLEQEGNLTAYRVRIEAHQVTNESYHKRAEECYYVIAGSGVATLDGKEYRLAAGDFIRLPPGTRHRFSTGEDGLTLLDIHSPGSRPNKDVYFTDETPSGFESKGT